MSDIDNIILYSLSAICFLAAFLFSRKSKNRKEKDKTPVPQHKSAFRTPTWRFQKYHPSSCPHHNGIYRQVEIKILDDSIKKTIFVCADCVSAIETDEVDRRDKFKS